LITATRSGNVKAIELLLKKNCIHFENCRLIFHEAQNNEDIFKLLLTHNRFEAALNLYIESFFFIDNLDFSHKEKLLDSILTCSYIKPNYIQTLLNQSIINWGAMVRVPSEDHNNIVKRLLSYPDVDPNKALPSRNSIYSWSSTGNKVSLLLETLISDTRTNLTLYPLDEYFDEHPDILTPELQQKIEAKKSTNFKFTPLMNRINSFPLI